MYCLWKTVNKVLVKINFNVIRRLLPMINKLDSIKGASYISKFCSNVWPILLIVLTAHLLDLGSSSSCRSKIAPTGYKSRYDC